MGGRHATVRRRVVDDAGEVRACLEGYAERGVFRGYTEGQERAGCVRFRFTWLARDPYELVYDPRSGTLTFVNVLPHVPARSTLATALRKFVAGRMAPALPLHRRIDAGRATARASVRNGTMRLQVVARRGHHGYAANRVVNLVHEVYLYLSSYYPEYLWDHYGLPQD